MQVFVICGYDDGTVSVTDITSALAFIGMFDSSRNHQWLVNCSMIYIDVGILQVKQYEDRKRSYDPRKLMQRQIKDADIAAATWYEAFLCLTYARWIYG